MQHNVITMAQATTIREEIDMFPGQKAAMLLVQRGFATVEQLAAIRTAERKEQPSWAASRHGTNLAPGDQIATAQAVRPVVRPEPAAAIPKPVVRPVAPVQRPPAPAAPVAAPAPAPQPASSSAAGAAISASDLVGLLKLARQQDGAVLHIRPQQPPFIRRYGAIVPLSSELLTPAGTQKLIFGALTKEQQQELIRQWQLEFSLSVPELGRHRCNVSRQQLGYEGAFKMVPRDVPTIEALGLPPVHKSLVDYKQGLIVVTGSSGSGKTTTIAAMLEHINQTRAHHIITIEDPLEYVFTSKQAHITQREIGVHTQNYAMALRGALRQDPDIMMIGDLRDLETTSIAISAAETGHLVLATLHTNSAMRTVARILDVFPPSQREQICVMISESLRGIITQQLIPRKDGNGVALAQEILVVTTAASQMIREGKTHLIMSILQSGKRLGMQTMDDALMELVQNEIISGDEGYNRADNKAAFEPFRSRT